ADLALVAAHLPGMSGLEVAKRLRAQNPDLVVILMGEEATTPVQTNPSTDVTAYLPKPFRFDALRALIESLQLTPAPAE
ncbi:MAG: response regulator, partial [Deltaproteobacteria bacterium]|nr:response regulator [Deltaproteobacteria bacterium]